MIGFLQKNGSVDEELDYVSPKHQQLLEEEVNYCYYQQQTTYYKNHSDEFTTYSTKVAQQSEEDEDVFSSGDEEEDLEVLQHLRERLQIALDSSSSFAISPFKHVSPNPPTPPRAKLISTPAQASSPNSYDNYRQNVYKTHSKLQRQATILDEDEIEECKPRSRSGSLSILRRTRSGSLNRKSVQWADKVGQKLTRPLSFSKFDCPFVISQSRSSSTSSNNDFAAFRTQLNASPICVDETFKFDNTELPATPKNIRALVQQKNVQLEAVNMKLPEMFFTVLVSDQCFNKRVSIRYSTDNWHTSTDVEGTYRSKCDDMCRFGITIKLDNYALIKKVEFCLHYEACDINQSFWDNNNDKNYQILQQ